MNNYNLNFEYVPSEREKELNKKAAQDGFDEFCSESREKALYLIVLQWVHTKDFEFSYRNLISSKERYQAREIVIEREHEHERVMKKFEVTQKQFDEHRQLLGMFTDGEREALERRGAQL